MQRYKHKNLRYYFFDNIINNKNIDQNNIKIDEKSYKTILIYNIGNITIKDSRYVKTNIVNPIYFIFNKENNTLKKLIKVSVWC